MSAPPYAPPPYAPPQYIVVTDIHIPFWRLVGIFVKWALAAIPAVAQRWKIGRRLVWIFNVEGTVDLFTAIALANTYKAAPYMGPAYWIPAFWVPALLVTHYITFVVLLRIRKEFA